jgi:hypothetical protein
VGERADDEMMFDDDNNVLNENYDDDEVWRKHFGLVETGVGLLRLCAAAV